MKKLTPNQIIRLQEKLVGDTGGSVGVRDMGLLESALAAPFQTFDGEYMYPSDIEKICRTAYGIIRNHPFIDGNKRVGTHVLKILLKFNRKKFRLTNDDVIHIGLSVADGSTDFDGLLKTVLSHLL